MLLNNACQRVAKLVKHGHHQDSCCNDVATSYHPGLTAADCHKFSTMTLKMFFFLLKIIIPPKQKLQDYPRTYPRYPYYPHSSCQGILCELHYGILNGIVMRIKHIRSPYRGSYVKARAKRDDLCLIPRRNDGNLFRVKISRPPS